MAGSVIGQYSEPMFGFRGRREPTWQFLDLDCGCWVEVVEKRPTLVGEQRWCNKHGEFTTVTDRTAAYLP